MITYKDMAFCTSKDCSGWSQCYRALTPEIEAKARETGLPLSMFCEPPMCYKPTEKKGTKK